MPVRGWFSAIRAAAYGGPSERPMTCLSYRARLPGRRALPSAKKKATARGRAGW